MTSFGRVITSCDLHYKADLEGGVILPHGRSVVIGEGVFVSKGCSIFQNTTMGAMELKDGFPHLDEGVNIYPGTVIAGKVKIGEYCRVGPNVYLTASVPHHTRVSPPKPHFARNILEHERV